MAEVAAREHAMRLRHKPKQAELDLRAKLRAMDKVGPRRVSEVERQHVLCTLREVEAEEEERHRTAVRREFELVERRTRDECEKARKRSCSPVAVAGPNE